MTKYEKVNIFGKVPRKSGIFQNQNFYVTCVMMYFAGHTLVYFMTVKYHTRMNMFLKRTWKFWLSSEEAWNIHSQNFVTTMIFVFNVIYQHWDGASR